MNVWVGWHKLHDGQSDIPIFQWKHEADKWVSQYKPGFAKLITLTEQKPWVRLTDKEINDLRLALDYDIEDLPDPWDFKQGFLAAERAYGIKEKNT